MLKNQKKLKLLSTHSIYFPSDGKQGEAFDPSITAFKSGSEEWSVDDDVTAGLVGDDQLLRVHSSCGGGQIFM